jgi:hypothetical protein
MVRTWLEVTFSFPSSHSFKDRIILNDIPQLGKVTMEEIKILQREKRKWDDLINLAQFCRVL